MSEAEQAQEPEVIGPGEILKQAREKQGLSLDEMAGKLHLKSVAIAKLEADDYDENISLTFTKGYLKLYAKHIGVEEERVLAAFDKQNTKNKEPAKLQSFSRRVAKQASDDRLMLVTYLIVAAVIAMVVVWWWQQGGSESVSNVTNTATESLQVEEEQPANLNVQESAPPIAEENVVANEQDIENDGANSIETYAAENADSILETTPTTNVAASELNGADLTQSDSGIDSLELQTENQAQEQELSVPTNAASIDQIQLVFTFAEDCWMNLIDANGEAIAYGVKKSGRVMTVAGTPPFEVTLGAPAVVQITYDGIPVDMGQFDAGRTAKFTLPITG